MEFRKRSQHHPSGGYVVWFLVTMSVRHGPAGLLLVVFVDLHENHELRWLLFVGNLEGRMVHS